MLEAMGALVFFLGSRLLAIARETSEVEIWDVGTGDRVTTLKYNELSDVPSIAFLPLNGQLVVTHGPKGLRLDLTPRSTPWSGELHIRIHIRNSVNNCMIGWQSLWIAKASRLLLHVLIYPRQQYESARARGNQAAGLGEAICIYSLEFARLAK
ncbi:hypothetical protein CHU98_g12508 [Xylaria longipes]|nr:hypothetical protein CHU98_g12508 [Xylaria longipes]